MGSATDFFTELVRVEWETLVSYATEPDIHKQNALEDSLAKMRTTDVGNNLRRFEGPPKPILIRDAASRVPYGVAMHGDSLSALYTDDTVGLRNRIHYRIWASLSVDGSWRAVGQEQLCNSCRADGTRCTTCGGRGFFMPRGEVPTTLPDATGFTTSAEPTHKKTAALWKRLIEQSGNPGSE